MLASALRVASYKLVHAAADRQEAMLATHFASAFQAGYQTLPDTFVDHQQAETALNIAVMTTDTRMRDGLPGLLLNARLAGTVVAQATQPASLQHVAAAAGYQDDDEATEVVFAFVVAQLGTLTCAICGERLLTTLHIDRVAGEAYDSLPTDVGLDAGDAPQRQTEGSSAPVWVHNQCRGLHALRERGEPHSAVGRAAADPAASDTRAAVWARKHAGQLIDDITETTRKQIRSIIQDILDGDIDWAEASRDLNDIFDDPDRVRMIARTESMTAVNAGQRDAWRQARKDGLLSARARVVWITVPGCCKEICEDMEGKTTGLNQAFRGAPGPPAHPNCRCTIGIQEPAPSIPGRNYTMRSE